MKKLILSGFVIAGISLAPYVSNAQYRDNTDLGNRLSQIEKQIQTLSRAVFRGETVTPPPAMSGGSDASTASAGSVANLEVRLSQIEEQIQQLTGQLEEQQYRIEQIARGGTTGQRTALEPSVVQKPAPSATPTSGQATQPAWNNAPSGTPSAPAANPTADLSSLSADALYEKSFVDIRDGNYDAAEYGFKTFLDKHSDHKLAANAQYWLAETHYVRGDYTEAAKLFARGYQNYPESSKVSDNLLKLGLSLAKLGKKDDACLTLKQLKNQFSDESGPVMRRADQEINRLSCD